MAKLKNINRYFEFYNQGCKEDAPVVLMLPGVSCGAGIWRDIVPYLTPHYKVILFNNPGLNGTPVPLTLTVEKIAKYAKEVLDYLNVDNCHVVGHSMGGFTAQAFTLNYSEMVDKLILVSTSYGGPHTQKYSADLAEEGFIKAFDKDHTSNLKDNPEKYVEFASSPYFVKEKPVEFKRWAHYFADIASDTITTLRHFGCASLFNSYGKVHEINKEVLVIHGKDDKLVRPDGGEGLAEQIPNAKLLMLENCGHIPMYEREETFSYIVDFLNGKSVGAAVKTKPAGKHEKTLDHALKTYALGFERIIDKIRSI